MAANPEKIRAFIAIHPPAEVIERTIELMAKLKRQLNDDAFRWVELQQLHLTLQFLGYIHRDEVEKFQEVIARTASQHKTFSLKTESLGCFPTVSRARVIWMGLSGEKEAVEGLKSDLDRALSPLGYQPETRRFHPHLTLARVSDLPAAKRSLLKEQIDAHAGYSAGDIPVHSVHLMQSVLSPKGADYHSLGRFPLQQL